MKKILILTVAALSLNVATAQNIKWYGFIRNYISYDSREMKAGTADMFSYLPLDKKEAVSSMSYTAITSRLGVDVSGYEYANWKFGAKIEADFYAGLSGVTGTATFRLRQAYLTASKDKTTYKMGQAWHPMAADFPDVFSLNTGAPFGPFNRSPLIQYDYKFSNNYSLTAATIWQMQYVSAGPEGASANYMKYSQVPELYIGLNYKKDDLTLKFGANMLSIKPRYGVNVKERITTFGAFAYAFWTKDKFSLKAKTFFGEGGEHLNLNSGYAVSAHNYGDGGLLYTPYRNSSTWVSLKYNENKLQYILFLGYVYNFGTREEIKDTTMIFFSKNSFANMNQMYRITPSVVYNFGKFQVGIEYELTSVQYGSWDHNSLRRGIANNKLHWVTNNRIQTMVKYSF